MGVVCCSERAYTRRATVYRLVGMFARHSNQRGTAGSVQRQPLACSTNKPTVWHHPDDLRALDGRTMTTSAWALLKFVTPFIYVVQCRLCVVPTLVT
jgi:hypothetical protein